MQHLKLIHATLQGNEENYVLCMSRDAGAGGQGSNCIPPPLPPPPSFWQISSPYTEDPGGRLCLAYYYCPPPPYLEV